VNPSAEIVAGIDVHKSVLMVVIAETGAVVDQQKFGTTAAELRRLSAWLADRAVTAVVMESTAQYWWPVWLALESHWPLYLAQARSNRAPHHRKTDWADAQRLTRRSFSQDLRYSYVADEQQRRWRRLTRTRTSLTEQIVEIRNEIEALLEEGSIKLSAWLSDLLGASGRRVLHALAAGLTDPEQLGALVDRRVRASQEQLRDALTGRLPAAHRLILAQHLERIALIERHQAEIDRQLQTELAGHVEALQRLCEVPGINVVAAQQLVAELGAEASAFPSAGHLASWAGVCPGREQSAEVSKNNRSPKGNRFVRSVITQVAHAASKTKGSFWEALRKRWQARLGTAKTMWAIAHRLLRLVWKILNQRVRYIERGNAPDPRKLQRRIACLKRQFLAHGYHLQFFKI
jgi:transposase